MAGRGQGAGGFYVRNEAVRRDTNGIATLRAAGALGLFAGRDRPPDRWNRLFEDLGPLDGGHIVADSRLGSRISDGTAIGAIRTPSGAMDSNPNSSRRRHPRRCIAVRVSVTGLGWGARQEVPYYCNATLPGQG